MRYTEEQHKFLREYIPGHTYQQIADEYNQKYPEQPITVSKVKGYMGNNKITSGIKGWFTKGHVPYNKGVKGVHYAGTEKTWFKKGNKPHNWRPIGSERVNKDGDIEIKVADGKGNRNWIPLKKKIYEEHYGPIPQGYAVLQLDNDKSNFAIDNLYIISKAVNCKMNQYGYSNYEKEAKLAAIKLVELHLATSKANKNRRAKKDECKQ